MASMELARAAWQESGEWTGTDRSFGAPRLEVRDGVESVSEKGVESVSEMGLELYLKWG